MTRLTKCLRFPLMGLALTAFIFTSGCAAVQYKTPVKPPLGILFSEYAAPLTVNFNETPALKKVSTSCTSQIFDPFFTQMSIAWDDAAIGQIAKEGGLNEVAYADYEFKSILGVFNTFTVNVYGN